MIFSGSDWASAFVQCMWLTEFKGGKGEGDGGEGGGGGGLGGGGEGGGGEGEQSCLHTCRQRMMPLFILLVDGNSFHHIF